MELTSATGNPQAPSLSWSDGALDVLTDDPQGRRRLRTGADGVATIASYTTRVPNPRGADRHRAGWQLLDETGRVVAWLGNSEREMYAQQDVLAFATAAGLTYRHLGSVSWSELRRIPKRARIGAAGTSVLGSFVAPPLQWVLCLVVIGGVMVAEGPTIRDDFSADSGGLRVTIAVLRILVGFFGGIVVAKILGRALLCYGEQRRWQDRGPTEVLRPMARPPATSITHEPDGLVVRDAFRRQVVAADDGIALQRYDVESRGGRLGGRGLLVRDPRKVALDVPGEFDVGELTSFAARIHARVMETETDPRQLPRRTKGQQFPVFAGRSWWRRGGRAVRVLLYASPVAAVAAVLYVLGVVPMPEWAAWELGGISLLVPGGWLLVRLQAPAWMVDPGCVPEPR
ncbi:MAG: hypothetical protein ACRDO7_10785 [Nocardioidaceae bacterium]